MERLRERLAIARRALKTLEELSLEETVSDVVRDAAIQRFEYTFEAIWKAAQLYLREVEGMQLGSPKSVIRTSMQTGLLSEDQARLALSMADDRNLTAHTYNETLAKDIFSRLSRYVQLIDNWLAGMEQKRRIFRNG